MLKVFKKLYHHLQRVVSRMVIYMKGLAEEISHMRQEGKVIVHIGLVLHDGDRCLGNVGDPYLYSMLERMFEHLSSQHITWIHKDATRPLSLLEILVYNFFASGIIVGGHGLIMHHTGRANTGWLFATPAWKLRCVSKPLLFEAIGFNAFYGQSEFSDIFKRHIRCCVCKSSHFSMRNQGSINCLSQFLTSDLKSKVVFQPCPTTVARCFTKCSLVSQKKKISICLAFDRCENRFNLPFNEIAKRIIRYSGYCKSMGYDVCFVVHDVYDVTCSLSDDFEKEGRSIFCLSGRTEKEIQEFYSSNKLVVGMRGHSLMIPWGLGIPVVSLTTQDKQLFFMQTIGHPEWSIDINDNHLAERLKDVTMGILNDYEKVISEMNIVQSRFWDVSKQNFQTISQLMQI